MSSRQQTRRLHGKRQELSSDLAQQYREIGIKAVAAASTTIAEGDRQNTEEDSDERQQSNQGNPRDP